jgi:hypothetical protein
LFLVESFMAECGDSGVMGVLCGSGEAAMPDGGVGGIGGIWYFATLVSIGFKLLIFLAWFDWGIVADSGCDGCVGCGKACEGGFGETGEKDKDRGPSRGEMGETGAFSSCA